MASGALVAATAWSAEPERLPELTVTAARSRLAVDVAPLAMRVLVAERLAAVPGLQLDDKLRSVPGVSLFRRSSSLVSNPASQGVSLRGVAPGAVSRSLVLLNDPFGGWVSWSSIPALEIDRVEIIPGGGSAVWGGGTLGGTVGIATRPLRDDSGAVALTLGDYATGSLEAYADACRGAMSVRAGGRVQATAGYPVVEQARRGAVDVAAGGEHRLGYGRAEARLGEARLSVALRAFGEERGNGTPYTRNRTRFAGWSARMAGGDEAHGWEMAAALRRGDFASTFSSVDQSRNVETPATDQTDVPWWAWDVSVLGRRGEGAAALLWGVEARGVDGRTREETAFREGRFTLLREAGGRQSFAGAFLLLDWRNEDDSLRLESGLRADRWSNSGSFRRETELATGVVRVDRQAPGVEGVAWSPRLGVAWKPSADWRLRGAAYRAFRVPTLGELHRPFRVGAVVTESNPGLRPERSWGGEVGVDWGLSGWRAALTAFGVHVEDAVSAVTLARGPGTSPLFGSLGPGVVGRQRLNLTGLRTWGVEGDVAWVSASGWRVEAAVFVVDARVVSAPGLEGLEGLRPLQTPGHAASFAVEMPVAQGWTLRQGVRWTGTQYEDDENRLRLAPVLTWDAAVVWESETGWSVRAAVDNVADARVETGRTAAGVVSVGMPRFASMRLERRW